MSILTIENFKDGRCWSDIDDLELKSFLNESHENFKKILTIALDNNVNSWRAAWLISKHLNNSNNRIKSYITKVIKAIPEKKSGHQRELLKLISKLKLSSKQEALHIDVCIDIWKNLNKKSGTRYYAILHLINSAKKHPDLNNEIEYYLQEYFTKSLSPGIKKNILKKRN